MRGWHQAMMKPVPEPEGMLQRKQWWQGPLVRGGHATQPPIEVQSVELLARELCYRRAPSGRRFYGSCCRGRRREILGAQWQQWAPGLREEGMSHGIADRTSPGKEDAVEGGDAAGGRRGGGGGAWRKCTFPVRLGPQGFSTQDGGVGGWGEACRSGRVRQRWWKDGGGMTTWKPVREGGEGAWCHFAEAPFSELERLWHCKFGSRLQV